MGGFYINSVVISIEVCALLIFSKHIFSIFTTNEEILNTMNSLNLLLCVIIVISSLQCFLKWIFRVIGWHYKIVCINAISFWIIGNLLIYIFAFMFDFKLLGIWMGYAGSLIIWIVIYLILFLRIDWGNEWRNTLDRIKDV